jgi:hypothetical protein
MKYTLVLVVAALPLAACNKSPEVHETNASVAEVANAVRSSGIASDYFLHAGQWQVSGTLEEMTIPGLPPQAQAEMKQVMGQHQNTTYTYCLTPEEAKQPKGKFFSGKEENNCRYDHFTMGGGKIDAAMHCESDGQHSMKMQVDGTYSPDSYETHVSMNMVGGREGNMSMKMRSEAHRVGACTGKES